MRNLKIFLLIIISIPIQVYGNYGPDHNDIRLKNNLLFQRPPSANAGPDQSITLPTSNFLLKGSAKDTNKDVVRYRWTQIDGPNMSAKIDAPSKPTTRVSNLLEHGVYHFQLTIIMFNGKFTSSDTVAVTVRKAPAANFPRKPKAGSNQTIRLPTSSVTLPEGGDDEDGKKERKAKAKAQRTSMYQWVQIDGPMKAKIHAPRKSTTLVDNLQVVGVYRFRLTQIDVSGVPDSGVIHSVRVLQARAPNPRPIVNAGADQSITLPKNEVVLSGSGKAFKGEIMSYKWTKVSGPNQPFFASFANPKSLISGLIEGVYTFQLSVTDQREVSASDEVKVTVRRAQIQYTPPVANAGPDRTISLPTNDVVLSGSGSSTTFDIDANYYKWTKIDGPNRFRIINPSDSITQVRGLVEGVYTFQLSVSDIREASDSDKVKVTVLPAHIPNRPPKANAGADQSITLPENHVVLSGKGIDTDGQITSFMWTKISGPSQFRIESPKQAQTQIRNLVEGVYQFELSVTDNSGLTMTDLVNINVISEALSSINWLIIGGLGLGILGTSLYFIFWIPIPKKIMVYFMHKDEEELVRKLMPHGRKTESYAIGNCNRGRIKKMKKKGLAVYALNTTKLQINTPGQTRSINYSLKKGKPKFEGIEQMARPVIKLDNMIRNKSQGDLKREAIDFPTFYIITLDEPLLPVYEKKLEGIGIEIIQHVPYNNYTVLIQDADQLKQLRSREFEFIRHDQHYTAYDTGLIIREEHRKQAAESGENIFLDLILHREEDLPKVSKFINGLDIKIIQSYRNRIRISASAQFVKDFNLSDNKFIQAIYEFIPPILHNDIARRLIGIDSNVPGKSYISETGKGEIIAVADTGIDLDHPDLKSQIIDAVSWGRKTTNDTSDSHGHGTHVTGSIVGDGTASNGKIKGMAPGAKVFFQSIMDDDESLASFDMQLHEVLKQAYQKGARIHNNSWGSSAESRYTFDSNTIDEFVYNNPEMLIVISVGNEGTFNSISDSEKGFIGFGSVCSPATNKNGLTVGASRNERKEGGYSTSLYGAIWPDKFPYPPTSMETISGDPKELAAYSSRGRCDDGRMKPDIVAPGTDILSTQSKQAPLRHFHGGFADYNDAYAFLGGTSMAAPIVSGAAAILREYFKTKKECSVLSAALVKATLINGTINLNSKSARHKGDSIPNPNQGYGMLDLSMTIPNEKNQFQLAFIDSYQDSSVILNKAGSQYTLKLHLKNKAWIRVCLAYTDYPARSIQNDLDLFIDHDQTREKWSGNPGINVQDIYRSSDEDRTNNIEAIRIEKAKPGLYTVKVIAHNLPMNESGQEFALVVTTSDMSANFEK